jgi:chromosome segregation ATPase
MARQAQSAVDMETKVALIERDMSHMVTMFEKLDSSIEKIAEVHVDMKQIISAHELRLKQQQTTNNDIYNELKEIRTESSEQHQQIQNKLMDLEKMRWMILGACGIITYMLAEFDIIFK